MDFESYNLEEESHEKAEKFSLVSPLSLVEMSPMSTKVC